MPYIVRDRIEVSLFINNVDYPIGTLNVLNFLHMAWSVRTMVPSIRFSITDQVGMLKSSIVQDAVPISVVIKPLGTDQSTTYNFRKFNHNVQSTVFGNQYDIDGYWDSIPFWFTTTSKGISGTSNDVLSSIASTCKLKYDGLPTSDSQLWLPGSARYCEFSKRVSDAGWKNDTSLMCSSLCLDGVLRYRDLNDLKPSQLKFLLGKAEEGYGNFVDFSPYAKSGFNNRLTGYSDTMYYQSATSSPQVYNQLSFTPDSTSPLYNQTVKGDAGRGMQRYSPIDFGNVHPMYEKAKYQNVRYSNLLNYGAKFLSIFPTTLTPLDKFNYSAFQSDGTPDPETSGDYIFTAQSIFIQGPNYFEKVEGLRHGTNTPKQSS